MSNMDEQKSQIERIDDKAIRTDKKGYKFKLLHLIIVFLAVEITIACIVGYNLIKMAIVPGSYIIIAGVALIIFNVLLFLSSKKIWTGIIMIILTCILSFGMVFGLQALLTVDKTIENITNNPEQQITEMAIIVLKDSGVHEIAGLKEFIVSYMNDADYEYTKKVMDEIDATVGGEVNYVEFKDKISMVDALYEKTVDAIIINKAYIDMISEMEGYETFEEDIKIIYSSEIVTYMDIVSDKETNLDTFIVYISGIDMFGAVTSTSRSDVNILAVVNTKTKHVQLINTPRDYYLMFPIENGVMDKLTHAGIYGVDCSMRTLENFYGINISYYVRMNFSGFENIIDSLGGIDVYSECDFTVEPIKHYTVGVNHLSGIEALAFARERYSFPTGDIQRGKNQMAVITAMINKMVSSDMLFNYSEVLDSIAESFQTNMSSDDIYSLVRQQLSDRQGWTIDSCTVTGTSANKITYAMPGREIYVMLPNETDVEKAKELINNTLSEK